MRIAFLLIVAATCAAPGFFGCAQSGTPKVETVQAPVADTIAEAKAILRNYSNGMPVTSEASSIPDLIARVIEKDAAKGELLDKALNEIKANPASAKAKATEVLKQL